MSSLKDAITTPQFPCKIGCLDLDGNVRECEAIQVLDVDMTAENNSEIVEEKPVEEAGVTSDEAEIVRRAPSLPASALSHSAADKAAMDRILTLLKGKVIEVEGNIGCGKSTLTSHLHKLIGLESGDETLPVLHGEKVNHTFLKAFYDEPQRLAFAFQMYMLTTRIYQMDEAHRQAKSEGKLVFLDRGAVGDILFALNNHVAGNITDADLSIYRSVCRERFPTSLSSNVDLVLYLDVSPSECWRRMTTVRQREAEAGVPPDYLYNIDNVYFELLIEWLGKRGGTYYDMNVGNAPPVAVVRWEQFGCARKMASVLADLCEGARPSPSVSFLDEKDTQTSYDITIDNAEDAQSVWSALRPALDAGAESFTLPSGEVIATNARVALALQWNMDRKACEAYRRVALWAMGNQSTLHFYGEGAVIPQK